jgi:hypothetical protein
MSFERLREACSNRPNEDYPPSAEFKAWLVLYRDAAVRIHVHLEWIRSNTA